MTRPLIIDLCRATSLSVTCMALVVACSARNAMDPAAGQADSGATIADLSAAPASAPGRSSSGDDREKAIAGYRSYLDRYPDSARRDTIARRLADLLVESAADMQAEEASGQQLATQLNTTVMDRYGEAISIYTLLLDKYRDDPDTAELLYQLSRAYEETGQAQLAIAAIDRLLAQGPASHERLYADVQFRRGELLFGEGQFPAAARAYREVVELGESAPAYEQALYKLGWSLFKQEQYEAALSTFFSLLDRKFPPGSVPETRLAGFSRAEREQLADVFRVISMSFSHQAGVESLVAYFRRHGSRVYEDRVYLNLAEFYSGHDQVTEAARTWLALAARAPRSAEAPRLYIKVIDIYRQAGFRQRVVETETVFVRRYGMSGDFWEHHSPQAFPDVVQRLRASLVDLAHHHHARAREGQRADDYRAAEQWYRNYLQAFADADEAAEMNYMLAELLYENGAYRQAIDEYERTAWDRGEHPLAVEAGKAAMHAYARYLKQDSAADRQRVSRRASSSALRFVAAYPHDPGAPAILAQTGTDMLGRRDYEEAIRVSGQLLEQEMSFPPAVKQRAWSIQAQAQFEQGDYRAAEHAYRQALSITEHDDSRWSALNKGLAAAIYKQAEQQQTAGDRRQAVILYLKAADTSADSSIQAKAKYDAATSLLAVEAWEDAARILEQFPDNHPGHPLQGKVTQKLAYAYDRSGRHLSAASEYMKLGRARVDGSLQREALMRASELFERAGKDRDAMNTLELYIGRFAKPADQAAGVMRKLADLESADGNAQRRRYWLEEIIKLDRSAGNAQTRMFAAHAALELAEDRHAGFRRIRLVKPLQKSLASKLAEMKRAFEAFNAAIDYGIAPVSSAATYNIASMYDELSQELRTSERPGNLGTAELEQYELLLEEQAAPFEQQAIEIYASNVRRAGAGQSDRWSEKSQQRLDVLRPGWTEGLTNNTHPDKR